MNLSTRYAGRAAIVDIQGRMTIGPALNAVTSRIESILLAKPASGLVLNLQEVPAIDSAGLGELAKIHSLAVQRAMRVALLHVNPKISEVLQITRLDGLFSICTDEASALQSVAEP